MLGPKDKGESENPGTEDNVAVPVDDRQAQQIGDMLGTPPPLEEGSDPTADAGAEKDRKFFDPTQETEEEVEEVEDKDRYGLGDRRQVEEPEEVEEVEEVEEPEPVTGEVGQLREQLAEMRGTLTALQQQLQGQGEKPEEPESDLPEIQVNPQDFFTEEEAEEFSVDPASVLRKVLSRVYQRAREDSLKDMPDVVTKATRRQTALETARQKFWNDNPDLLQKTHDEPTIARLIQITANEIGSEEPSWSIEQVFEETGNRVRKALGTAKQAKEIERTAGKKPKHPGKPKGKRRGQEQDTRSPEQKQIDAMISTAPARR